jgi:hypothetical protein
MTFLIRRDQQSGLRAAIATVAAPPAGAGCALIVVALLASLLSGCGAINPPPTIATVGGRGEGRRIDRAPQPQRIDALSAEIAALSPAISPQEAQRCADRAVRYTALLAEYHGLTRSAEWNSLMVNLGLKRRGQCFQLADDLNAELAEQRYLTLVFTRAIVHWDQPFLEHNCIVVTAPGQAFEDGLVLDPWRNPGVLRWARVKLDQYPWQPRIVNRRDQGETDPDTATPLARR